jgi:hypothetical protein
MIEKNTSTRFSQDAEVGVKCSWMRGWLASQAQTVGLVGGVVVTDKVQLPAWVAVSELSEEPEELLVTVAGSASVDDTPGGDLQRGEQGGGAMAAIVVRAPLGPVRPDAAHGLGALQGLDLGLLVDAEHDRALGWVQVEPDDVVDLGGQFRVGGELERLGSPGLHAILASDPGDAVAADAELAGQQPGRPVGDPQPGRWRVEGDCQDLGPAEPTDRLWSSRPGPVGESVQPAADIPAAAGDHGRAGDADALGDLGVGDALGGQQQDAGAPDEHGPAAGQTAPIGAARPGRQG